MTPIATDGVFMKRFHRLILTIGGLLNLGLFIFHAAFWRMLDWKVALSPLDEQNRVIIQMLNISVMVMLLLMAHLSLVHKKALVESRLGKTLLVWFMLFYLVRIAEELIFVKFKIIPSGLIILVCALMVAIYFIPAIYRRGLSEISGRSYSSTSM